MKVTDLAAFQKSERRSVVAQAKLTPSESRDLDEFVKFCRAHGVPEATRSSAIRALVLDGLQVFKGKQAPDSPAGVTARVVAPAQVARRIAIRGPRRKEVSMTEPMSRSNDPNDKPKEVNGAEDSALEEFHERNRQRKRRLIGRIARGAARDAMDRADDQFDLSDQFHKFVSWLQEQFDGFDV